MGWVFAGIILFDLLWVLFISPIILRKVSYNHGLPGMVKYFRIEACLLTITAMAAVISALIFAQDDLYKLVKYWT